MKTLEDLRGEIPQNKAAKMLGISKSYLSLLEKGKRRMSLDIAEKLGEVYGVSLNEVLRAYKVCRKSILIKKMNRNNSKEKIGNRAIE
ncbi:MAG: helix-turn-helix transcriptional regulator [Bacillota bacterium]